MRVSQKEKEKNEKKIFTRMIKSVMMMKKMKPIGTAYPLSKRWTRPRVEAQKERKKDFRWGH